MRKFLLIVSLFLIVFNIQSQTAKEEIFENPEKAGGVYYAYPTPSGIHTKAPKGYKPFYISHYGRHGSRYLIGDEDYHWIIRLFNDANNHNALSPLGKDVLNRLNIIWVEADGCGGELTPLGERQQRGIAQRMYNNYPKAFEKGATIDACATIVVRCVLSMDAFCERLKEMDPSLSISRKSGAKYMRYLNYHSDESNKFTGSDGPWREEYKKFEKAHTNSERLANSLFSDKDYLLKNVNYDNLMWGLYWVAVDMQNMETKVDFFDLFERQELFDLWQIVNYRTYVCDSNYPASHKMLLDNLKPQLKNIITTADDIIAKNGRGASLRFGHDGNIIPLAALLELKDCYNSVSNPYEIYKNFSTYLIAPMGANIQIIFYRNKKENSDILVKFLQNEEETSISIPTDIAPYYHWKDVRTYYLKKLSE